MAKQTKSTELPLDNATKLLAPQALSDLFKTERKSRQALKKFAFLLWNWSFLYYNLSEGLSLPYTLLLYLQKENEQMKHKMDKLAPAKQSLTSHLSFPGIVWMVTNHMPQCLHWNHNKQGSMCHHSMLTIRCKNTTQTGRSKAELITKYQHIF